MTDFMMVVGYITTMATVAIAIGAAAMVICFMQSEEKSIKQWFDNFKVIKSRLDRSQNIWYNKL